MSVSISKANKSLKEQSATKGTTVESPITQKSSKESNANSQSSIKKSNNNHGRVSVVRLVFCQKQKVQKGERLKVSIRQNWPYYLEKAPNETISITLKKFKLVKNDDHLIELLEAYRVYRVREDPKTKYRYVTEILNKEEGLQLIGGKKQEGVKQFSILITHKDMIKNPQEDFKNMLDEAERQQIRYNEQIEIEKTKGINRTLKNQLTLEDYEAGREPLTYQSQQSDQVSQPSVSSSGAASDTTSQEQPRPKREIKPKAQVVQSVGTFNDRDNEKIKNLYPNLEMCAKNPELYKCTEAIDLIKEKKDTFKDQNDMQKKLINLLNKVHQKMTGDGNKQNGTSSSFQNYQISMTPSYVNVQCGIGKKCRFSAWYKFEKNQDDEPVNIKWFRTINCNHDIAVHKEFNFY